MYKSSNTILQFQNRFVNINLKNYEKYLQIEFAVVPIAYKLINWRTYSTFKAKPLFRKNYVEKC